MKEHYIFVIIALVLGLGLVSGQLDQQFVLGPLILGLSVPEGHPPGSALVKKFQLCGTWFLLPIFVSTCMMKVDLSLKYTPALVLTVTAFILLTNLIKILACWVL